MILEPSRWDPTSAFANTPIPPRRELHDIARPHADPGSTRDRSFASGNTPSLAFSRIAGLASWHKGSRGETQTHADELP